jgi:hypothetical protein
LRIESTNKEVSKAIYLRIRSYNCKGSQQKEHKILALRRNIILLLIHNIGISQLEVVYLYQSEVGVWCAFAFRETSSVSFVLVITINVTEQMWIWRMVVFAVGYGVFPVYCITFVFFSLS